MEKFCPNCGAGLKTNQKFCSSCGYSLLENMERKEEGNVVTYTYEEEKSNPKVIVDSKTGKIGIRRSRLAAGLLGIFLGWLGIHNFYLGFTEKGLTQLLIGTIGSILCGLGPIVTGIWGLIDGIIILSKSDYLDADGNELGE